MFVRSMFHLDEVKGFGLLGEWCLVGTKEPSQIPADLVDDTDHSTSSDDLACLSGYEVLVAGVATAEEGAIPPFEVHILSQAPGYIP